MPGQMCCGSTELLTTQQTRASHRTNRHSRSKALSGTSACNKRTAAVHPYSSECQATPGCCCQRQQQQTPNASPNTPRCCTDATARHHSLPSSMLMGHKQSAAHNAGCTPLLLLGAAVSLLHLTTIMPRCTNLVGTHIQSQNMQVKQCQNRQPQEPCDVVKAGHTTRVRTTTAPPITWFAFWMFPLA